MIDASVSTASSKSNRDEYAEFDRYAEDYEALLKNPIRDGFASDSFFFAERKWLLIERFLRRQGRDLSSMCWLDIGCGKGQLLRLGRSHFRSVSGCDPSRGMVQKCEDLDIRHQPDSERLPFRDRSFDLVTAVCVYHHVSPEARLTLTKEAARVLRPGGVFGIIEHNPYNPATRIIVNRTPIDRTAHLLTSSETSSLMKNAQLALMQAIFFLYLPAKLYHRLSEIESALEWLPLGGQYAVFARKQ